MAVVSPWRSSRLGSKYDERRRVARPWMVGEARMGPRRGARDVGWRQERAWRKAQVR
jgi:hypothetical protein